MRKDGLIKGFKWDGNAWNEKKDTEEKLIRYGYCFSKIVWLREQIVMTQVEKKNGLMPSYLDQEVVQMKIELERLNKEPVSHLEAQRQLDNYFKKVAKEWDRL